MAKKYPSELNTKTVRIGIGAWALLTDISRRAGVTIAEALDLALKGHKPEPKPEPAQIPMTPVFFEPKSIESNGARHGAAAFKPKSITGNGVTHIKLKSIR
ncbi:unnamed protein product, partial [marine sediment metagenome]